MGMNRYIDTKEVTKLTKFSKQQLYKLIKYGVIKDIKRKNLRDYKFNKDEIIFLDSLNSANVGKLCLGFKIDEWLTKHEAGRLLGVRAETFLKYARDGVMPAPSKKTWSKRFYWNKKLVLDTCEKLNFDITEKEGLR